MKFGDNVTSPFAHDTKSRKNGFFVRWVYRKGIVNTGKLAELTDGNGAFWQAPVGTYQKVVDGGEDNVREVLQ